jgi:hypothetical protein
MVKGLPGLTLNEPQPLPHQVGVIGLLLILEIKKGGQNILAVTVKVENLEVRKKRKIGTGIGKGITMCYLLFNVEGKY